jgi:hypothetical protein
MSTNAIHHHISSPPAQSSYDGDNFANLSSSSSSLPSSSSSDPLAHLSAVFDSTRYEPPVMVQQTAVYEGAGGIHKLEGDTLRLDCLVDGSPQPTIIWFKVRTVKGYNFARNNFARKD